MNDEVVAYIKQRMDAGISKEMVCQELRSAGWPQKDIDEACGVAQAAPAAAPAPTQTAPTPQTAPVAEQPAAQPQPTKAAPNGKSILLVEDEKALATVLNLKLQSAGYATDIMYNGDDALSALKAKKYDLLLIDIMMPKRDGFSVLDEMKKMNDQTPVFAMSNLGQDEDVARIKKMGVKDYIIKADASPGDILARVQKFFGQ